MMKKPSTPFRLFRGLARGLIFLGTELFWCFVFTLAGRLVRSNARRLVPTGRDRVLVLAPHPDDETIGCGGTIALHVLAGDDVTVCIATDGGNSRAGGLPREEMKTRRRKEAQTAAAALGHLHLMQLDMPEGGWEAEQLSLQLVSIITHVRPTLVYTTSIVDYHPEHVRVARSLADGLRRVENPDGLLIRLYEVQVPLTPLLANLVAHIEPVKASKANALTQYSSQRKSLSWVPRFVMYQRQLYRANGPVELFCEISTGRFLALCDSVAARPVQFRGIHERPFTDIAAWLVGTRDRLQMRVLIKRSSN